MRRMSSSLAIGFCITWNLFMGISTYAEDAVVLYRNYPSDYRLSNPQFLSPEGAWTEDIRRRSDVYRRDTQDQTVIARYPQYGTKTDTLTTITETIGALNTVGSYIVDMTRGDTGQPPKELPSAIYTISKNILGRNVTDSIAPLVRVLPLRPGILKPIETITTTLPPVVPAEADNRDKESSNPPPSCTTAEGSAGKCQDLSNCPQLLLDLTRLRQSLCFKSLFVPGVCCPVEGSAPVTIPPAPEIITTSRPIRPYRPTKPSTPRPIPLHPITTVQPPAHIIPSFSSNGTNGLESVETVDNNYIQDDDECGMRYSGKFRVVGGEEALPGRWPWMAAIFLRGSRGIEFWCGGSLIGPRHILTAAHCTRDNRQKPFMVHQFTVRLGDIDLERDDEPSSPETYNVKSIKAHPKFNRVGYYNDIALLELTRPVKKSPYVVPICLPPPRYRNDLFVQQRPTVVGWGTTYYGGKESTVQRQAVLPVWRNEDCNAAYFQPITNNFMCAGYIQGKKDACQGDSGGPLMLKIEGRWTQIGIVSFGNKCGEPGYPGVYTRVTSYQDWIKSNYNPQALV